MKDDMLKALADLEQAIQEMKLKVLVATNPRKPAMPPLIINLTQHDATQAQTAEGVRASSNPDRVRELLTFDSLPTREELKARAVALARIAASDGAEQAMIGGASYLMPFLEAELCEWCIQPLYAFSKRESQETVNPDGTVTKSAVFRHLGFVEGEKP